VSLPEFLPDSVLGFDLESNGLLDTMDCIHCLVIKDLANGQSYRFNGTTVQDGVRLLEEHTYSGGLIMGHNVIKFDIPAIQKIYPWFSPLQENVRDTLVLARLIFTDLIGIDTWLMNKGKLPKHLFKRHSLEAWGYRLGVFKDEYSGDPSIPDEKERKKRKWERWNQAMEDYCVQDVEATAALWDKCMSKGFSEESIVLEHQVAFIVSQQERNGFGFDSAGARKLYAEMVGEKLKIEFRLKDAFLPRYFRDGPVVTPDADRKRQEEALGLDYSRPITKGRGKNKTVVGYKFKTIDYSAGADYQKIKLVEFNPGSRVHIATWLKALHGWEPDEFTESGEAKVDETVLSSLPYPEAKVFVDYLTITKRLGQLSEGNESWLRHERSGTIHGQLVTNGAVTGRATHSNPNMGQVPAVKKTKNGILMGLEGGWGYECRALFCPTVPGNVQVGIDMSGIELRCLGHYMANWDGGAYGRIVVEGDVHTENQKAAGLDSRDVAKTFIYAFLYGAGGEKLEKITGKTGKKPGAAGYALKKKFLKNLPALGKLIAAVEKRAKSGYLKGLDGRHLKVRSAHAALNTLLQSAGAVLSKRWMVLFHKALRDNNLSDSVRQMAWVHDEIQVECPPAIAHLVGKIAVQAIEDTGKSFNFRVPITGEYKVGNNWAACH